MIVRKVMPVTFSTHEDYLKRLKTEKNSVLSYCVVQYKEKQLLIFENTTVCFCYEEHLT